MANGSVHSGLSVYLVPEQVAIECCRNGLVECSDSDTIRIIFFTKDGTLDNSNASEPNDHHTHSTIPN